VSSAAPSKAIAESSSHHLSARAHTHDLFQHRPSNPEVGSDPTAEFRYLLAMHTVGVAVLDGAPIFELAVPCEVFGIPRPDLADPWYELRLCGPPKGDVRVGSGFRLESEFRLKDLATADTVIVPACGNRHGLFSDALIDAIRSAHSRGARIAAICSGAFVLAAAGILDGRRATTHWMHAVELARQYPRVNVDASVLYLEDEGVFTSAGTAAGLDLCVELVRRDHGAAVANALARRLVIPPHRDGGQSQYVEAPIARAHDHGDPLSQVLEWSRRHLDEPLRLRDLARAGNMSTRTLARRFEAALGMSPKQWLLNERIRTAQELLETSDESVDRIAARVGFGSDASLRKGFAKRFGVSPAAYRRTFHRHVAGAPKSPASDGTSEDRSTQ
jgi:AraC family transcriptional activator FtrA